MSGSSASRDGCTWSECLWLVESLHEVFLLCCVQHAAVMVDLLADRLLPLHTSLSAAVRQVCVCLLSKPVTQGPSLLLCRPIFGSDDILQQMPNEGRKFKAVDASWRRLMERLAKQSEVTACSFL